MDERWVDVSHEALIRGWPRLREWIDKDRAGLQLHHRLTGAAKDWQEANRDESMLYSGARLVQAVEWRERNETELNELERAFLDASMALKVREEEEEKERQQRELEAAQQLAATEKQRAEAAQALARSERKVRVRQRYFMIGLFILFVVAILIAYFALEQQKISRSRELAANAISQLPIDPELSVLLAAEATRVRYTAQAEDALRQSLLESRVRAAMRGHMWPVYSAAFSPDGKSIVTASLDQTAQIWEASTGKSLMPLGGHKGPVYSAAFSPDGQLVVTASEDGTARVWTARTGQPLRELQHTVAVFSAAFSPDGKLVVTASADGTARVWEATIGQSVAELRGHEGPVRSAAFSPDGRFLVTASDDNTIRVWEANTGKGLAELRGQAEAVYSAAFSANGKLVVAASKDKTAVIYAFEEGGSFEDLLELASERIGLTGRELTPTEREKFLHESPSE